jgi:hypothetical protein
LKSVYLCSKEGPAEKPGVFTNYSDLETQVSLPDNREVYIFPVAVM